MKFFRCTLFIGKPRKIICTGCGKRAPQAGFAIHGEPDEIHGVPGHPLCEACLAALERAEQR